jgi:photosystem II stability/assembly factor-like uncharacterized protein
MTAARLWQAARPSVACCGASSRRTAGRSHFAPCILLLLAFLAPTTAPATAHDASTYGGVFRSRSMGNSWLNADTGLFLNAALVVAVDPVNSNHLLMGSDAGLMESVNGGRSWNAQAPDLVNGAVFAATFSPDGSTALCVTPGGIYRSSNGRWHRSAAPAGATPARGIVFGATSEKVYLLGQDRLFSSNDGGEHFVRLQADGDDIPAPETLAIIRQPSETLFAITQGRLMASTDGGRQWHLRILAGTAESVETVIPDPAVPNRIWAAAANRLYVSTDTGLHWQAFGDPLPETRTVVRGIATDSAATTLVVSTHRGTYRSTDAGTHWTLQEDTLPVHLEAGPLARDPHDPGILYVVYSLIPYPEVWRSALNGTNLLNRADPMSLIGGLAFLLLLLLSGVILVVFLARWRRNQPGVAR